MDDCSGDLNYNIYLIYLDDLIIFSSTFEEHLERLAKVFEWLPQYSLKLAPKKVSLLPTEDSIGHIVSADGTATAPEKIHHLMTHCETHPSITKHCTPILLNILGKLQVP